MRTDVKIGIIVALVLAVGTILYMVGQNGPDDADVVFVDQPDTATETPPQPAPATTPPGRTTMSRTGGERATQSPTTPRERTTAPPRATPTRTTSPPAQRQTTTPRTAQHTPTEAAPLTPPAQPRSTSPTSLEELVRRSAGITDPPAEPPATQPAASPPLAGPLELPTRTPPAERPAPAPATESASPATGLPRPGVELPPRPAEPTDRSRASAPGFRPTAKTRTHTVARGDTLWDLAAYYYGDGRLHTRILAANPILTDPNILPLGEEIVIPEEQPVREAPVTDPDARRSLYVVERGDSLISIARNLLKDGSRWREIYELNRDQIQNPDVLPVGLELKIPK